MYLINMRKCWMGSFCKSINFFLYVFFLFLSIGATDAIGAANAEDEAGVINAVRAQFEDYAKGRTSYKKPAQLNIFDDTAFTPQNTYIIPIPEEFSRASALMPYGNLSQKISAVTLTTKRPAGDIHETDLEPAEDGQWIGAVNNQEHRIRIAEPAEVALGSLLNVRLNEGVPQNIRPVLQPVTQDSGEKTLLGQLSFWKNQCLRPVAGLNPAEGPSVTFEGEEAHPQLSHLVYFVDQENKKVSAFLKLNLIGLGGRFFPLSDAFDLKEKVTQISGYVAFHEGHFYSNAIAREIEQILPKEFLKTWGTYKDQSWLKSISTVTFSDFKQRLQHIPQRLNSQQKTISFDQYFQGHLKEKPKKVERLINYQIVDEAGHHVKQSPFEGTQGFKELSNKRIPQDLILRKENKWYFTETRERTWETLDEPKQLIRFRTYEQSSVEFEFVGKKANEPQGDRRPELFEKCGGPNNLWNPIADAPNSPHGINEQQDHAFSVKFPEVMEGGQNPNNSLVVQGNTDILKLPLINSRVKNPNDQREIKWLFLESRNPQHVTDYSFTENLCFHPYLANSLRDLRELQVGNLHYITRHGRDDIRVHRLSLYRDFIACILSPPYHLRILRLLCPLSLENPKSFGETLARMPDLEELSLKWQDPHPTARFDMGVGAFGGILMLPIFPPGVVLCGMIGAGGITNFKENKKENEKNFGCAEQLIQGLLTSGSLETIRVIAPIDAAQETSLRELIRAERTKAGLPEIEFSRQLPPAQGV